MPRRSRTCACSRRAVPKLWRLRCASKTSGRSSIHPLSGIPYTDAAMRAGWRTAQLSSGESFATRTAIAGSRRFRGTPLALKEWRRPHPLSSITRAFLVLILAVPLFAQEAATTPNFFIETIEVREARRVSPHVVVAESRLREGQEYSEAELRDASARLMRLPFLLSAEFS